VDEIQGMGTIDVKEGRGRNIVYIILLISLFMSRLLFFVSERQAQKGGPTKRESGGGTGVVRELNKKLPIGRNKLWRSRRKIKNGKQWSWVC